MQAKTEHPLAKFGYQKPPHWLWRASPRAWIAVAAAKDIWLIVTGRLTLHSAWQAGHDYAFQAEVARQMNVARFVERSGDYFQHKPNCTDRSGIHRVPIDCPT